jgi:hypothetical protein
MHVLEGFEKVFDALDEIIKIIRKSDGKADSAAKIMKRFELDAEQTDAILEAEAVSSRRLEIWSSRTSWPTSGKRAPPDLRPPQGRGRPLEGRSGRDRGDPLQLRQERQAPNPHRIRKSVSFTEDDFIVEEDNVVLVSRDGWVKRQKEVRDLSTTRLREGDSVLAVLPGSTRASVVLFSNFGAAYTARIIDVPASLGTASRCKKLFKLPRRRCASSRHEPPTHRSAGEITPKPSRGRVFRPPYPKVHAIAVTSEATACGSASTDSSSPARARGGAMRARRTASKWSACPRSAATRSSSPPPEEATRHSVPRRRGELPPRVPGQGCDPDQAFPTRTKCSGSSHRPATVTSCASRRRARGADDQHHEVRGHGRGGKGRELLQRGSSRALFLRM